MLEAHKLATYSLLVLITGLAILDVTAWGIQSSNLTNTTVGEFLALDGLSTTATNIRQATLWGYGCVAGGFGYLVVRWYRDAQRVPVRR